MSVLWVGVATSVVMGAANMAAGKKRAKAQNEAMKEAAYVEGSAPIIPASNQLEIETIGEAPSGTEGSAPDFHEALEGSYGDGIYDTQEFGSGPQQEIPPELEELLMMQSSGQEPTNVQFSSSGGPVGLPEDVYHFPVEKISQMQMDVDPGVRNVGNAMMAQMEANPGMGMVGASAADIDQMAAGGPVRPKKYQDGSEGGVEGTGVLALLEQLLPPDREHMAVDEYDSDGNLIERSITYSSSKEGDPLVSDARTEADEVQMMSDFFSEDQLHRLRGGEGGPSLAEIRSSMRPSIAWRRRPQLKAGIPRPPVSSRGLESLRGLEAHLPEEMDRDMLAEILSVAESKGRNVSDSDMQRQRRMFKAGMLREAPMATGGPVQPRRYQDGSEGGITPQGTLGTKRKSTLTTSGYASNTPRITEYEDPSEVDPQIREYLELQNSLSGLGIELLHTITTPETPIEQSINTIRGLFSNWNESPDLEGTIFDSTDAARQRVLDRQGLSQEERRDLYFQDMEDAQAKQGREDALRAFIEMQRDKRRATGGPVQPRRY